MIYFRSGRHVVSVCAAIAMLAGCGGAGSGNGIVPTSDVPDHLPNHKTFYYTGGARDFKVPAGLRQIKVDVRGAKGDGSPIVYGGRVRAVIPVTPGEKLVVYVGGDASGLTGGFNGGGGGAPGGYGAHGYGGGGASDVREDGNTLLDRIVVAGGGGGDGGVEPYNGCKSTGGKGGGLTAGSGTGGARYSQCGGGGTGGTQTAGGSGGAEGINFFLDITEMLAVTVRSAPAGPGELEGRAVREVITRRAPVEAVAAAVITAAVAAALAVPRTVVIIPAEAAGAVAAPRMSSQPPRTCICGEAGKIEPTTVWSSSAGSRRISHSS